MDWRVEFAEVFAERQGIDVAIANPPYVQLQRDGGRLASLYRGTGYVTFNRTGDIYQLFYERGCQILKPSRGLLAYITSNSWLKAEYGKPLRRYFSQKHRPLLLLELGNDVFESAIVDSGVMLLREGDQSEAFPAVDMDRVGSAEIPPATHLWGKARPAADAPWSVLSTTEWSILDKMDSAGIPLKDWELKINRGITTGLNEAFVIDGATREALIAKDPKSEDIIKPVLRGRDVQRYRAQWAGRWLIDTHNGNGNVSHVNIERYPAVKAHLDCYFPKLERRQDKGRTPYNLRNCAYHEEFAKEKLIWMDLTGKGRVALDDRSMFSVDTTFFMAGRSLKYLCAAFNSTLATWFMKNTALTSGMGVTRWKAFTVEAIPIPKISAESQRPFVELVDKILEAKDAGPAADTSELEAEIDQLVYDLYGLTEEEIAAVERSLGLIHATDEEEDAALYRAIADGKRQLT